MGNSDKVAENISAWLKGKLAEIGWTQKQLADFVPNQHRKGETYISPFL